MDEEKRDENNSEDKPEEKSPSVKIEHRSESSEERMPREKKETLTDVMRKDPWKVSTVVLGILAIILIVANFSGGMTGNVIAPNDAGAKLLEFYESSGAEGLELDSVEEINGLYQVNILYEGNTVPIFVTKDGELAGTMSPLTMAAPTQTEQPAEIGDYTEEDLVKLGEFSSCLATKGIKIYGANWCGWTKKLVVETLGGFDVAGDAYIECTEEAELCSEEGVTGYPTIKLNGEVYTGERTLASLGEATSCVVPVLEGSGAVASSDDASC
jgi:hypothetical protein